MKPNQWLFPAGYGFIEHILLKLTKDDFHQANQNGITFPKWKENVTEAFMLLVGNCNKPKELRKTITEHG